MIKLMLPLTSFLSVIAVELKSAVPLKKSCHHLPVHHTNVKN